MTHTNDAENRNPTPLERLHRDVREGHACVVTLNGPRGLSFVEILGPRGMRPDGDTLVAPIPTLRLVLADHEAPEATAIANQHFEAGLCAIQERARPHVDPDEWLQLASVLAVVRAAAKALRFRVPRVGPSVTESGTPSFAGWASCLSLGDLDAALRKAAV